jgi:hypothetical protein
MNASAVITTLDASLLKEWRQKCGLLVCCAGYEERAFHAAALLAQHRAFPLRLIRLSGGDAANDQAFEAASAKLQLAAADAVIDYSLRHIAQAGQAIQAHFQDLVLPEEQVVVFDISGLPAHGICQFLYVLRRNFPSNRIVCFYTAASTYYPTEREYKASLGHDGTLTSEKLPESLTYEASDNLILPVFSGFSVRQDRTCLILFAGFEKHRSVAALDSCNPSRLVLIYATSEEPSLDWRVNLSRQLHADLFASVERAEEEFSTTAVMNVLGVLAEYYDMLYDDMSIVIAPINSKLHTLAAYLFWEARRDVQLTFPLPVRYLASRSSKGIGSLYAVELPQTPQVVQFLGLK